MNLSPVEKPHTGLSSKKGLGLPTAGHVPGRAIKVLLTGRQSHIWRWLPV